MISRRQSPWTTPKALGWAAAGAVLGLAAWTLSSGAHLPLRLAAVSAIGAVCYAAGVLLSYRRAELEDARRVIDLQEELRFSQDHIMANETFRSLGAYLEIAAHQMKEPLQTVASGVAALAANGELPEATRRQVAALRTGMDHLNET